MEHRAIIEGLLREPNIKKRLRRFRDEPPNIQGFILLALPKNIAFKIIKRLSQRELINIFHYLDPDDVTDLLQFLKPRKQKEILEKLSKDLRSKVEYLLKFSPDSAAGLMSLDYVEVSLNSSFAHVSLTVKKHEKKTGKFPTILVVEQGYLVGELPGSTRFLHKSREKIKDYIIKIPTLPYDVDKDTVIKLFKRNTHNKVVVLDDDNSIMGIIFVDDVLRLIANKQESSLYNFAGLSKEEDVLDNFLRKFLFRYKWLIINLGTAFFASFVVGLFQKTIAKYVVLAIYMPIVAGMGGNAATQTLAIMVRGLTLKEVSYKNIKKVIFNEVLAGFLNGLLNGFFVGIVALLFNHSAMLGIVIGLSMILNLVIAAFFGAIIPLIMKGLGKDPATSSSIFITTATDVCGFLSFLGLATILL